MNKLDPFEKLINQKLQDHNVEFSYDSWDAMERKLPKANYNTAIFATLGVIALAASTFFILKSNQSTNTVNSSPIIKNETHSLKSIENKIELVSEKNNELNSTNPVEKPSVLNTDESTNLNEAVELSKIIVSEKKSELLNKNNNTNKPLLSNSEKVKIQGPQSSSKTVDSQNLQQNTPLLPQAEFSVNKTNVCCSEAISFFSQKNRHTSYFWDFDDGNSSTISSPSHQFDEPGNYLVTLKVSNKDNPTQFAVSDPISITVYPSPKPNFTYEKIVEDGIPCVSFNTSPEVNNKIKWNFGDGSSSELNNVTHRYKKGIYQVSLEQKNEDHCIALIIKPIEILEDFNLFAPNSFTPDGDGINDTFIPESLKLMNVEFVMNIYNKQGKLIFKTKNINQPWNGINQNSGQKCSQGSYIWVVQLVNKNGENEQYNGALLLLN